jgi:hypothetical protein
MHPAFARLYRKVLDPGFKDFDKRSTLALLFSANYLAQLWRCCVLMHHRCPLLNVRCQLEHTLSCCSCRTQDICLRQVIQETWQVNLFQKLAYLVSIAAEVHSGNIGPRQLLLHFLEEHVPMSGVDASQCTATFLKFSDDMGDSVGFSQASRTNDELQATNLVVGPLVVNGP